MTITIPGEEPVGYTYKAENYPASIDFVVGLSLRLTSVAPSWPDTDRVDPHMRELAAVLGYEYDDPRSYDSDDFPKPIYADQLSCSDSEWTELAPSHTFEFIPREDGVAHCMFCGVEELPNRKEADRG